MMHLAILLSVALAFTASCSAVVLDIRATPPPNWRFSNNHYNLTLPNNRWAWVHINSTIYDNSVAHPLVLAFHGAGAGAETMEDLTGLSNPGISINGHDIVVVYGQSTLGTNGENAWQGAPYSATGVNDVSYVQAILNAVQGNLNIDVNRIYAVGFSNGGGLTNLLACTGTMSKNFAAFATSSPALYNGTLASNGCNTGGHPVALIDFHGLADGQIPYQGELSRGNDVSYWLPNIDVWRQSWAQRAGCGAPPSGKIIAPTVTTLNYDGFNATSYRWNCPSATVIGYTVQAMGHEWLTTAEGFWDETTQNILTFFNARSIGDPV